MCHDKPRRRTIRRLQKVFSCPSSACRDGASVIRYSGEDGEVWFQVFAESHNTSNITAAIAVIWCRPDCHYVLVLKVVFVAFIDQLMSTGNEL
jgi:hypothetical protein